MSSRSKNGVKPTVSPAFEMNKSQIFEAKMYAPVVNSSSLAEREVLNYALSVTGKMIQFRAVILIMLVELIS